FNSKFKGKAYLQLGHAFCYKAHKRDFAKAIANWEMAVKQDIAPAYNELAWLLATCPDPNFRDPTRAVELAKKAVELPKNEGCWNTLGVAHYRAADWKAAVEALNKSMQNSYDWFFLAMAQWQLGKKDDARKWYDRAVQWMNQHAPQDEQLRRFRG